MDNKSSILKDFSLNKKILFVSIWGQTPWLNCRFGKTELLEMDIERQGC